MTAGIHSAIRDKMSVKPTSIFAMVGFRRHMHVVLTVARRRHTHPYIHIVFTRLDRDEETNDGGAILVLPNDPDIVVLLEGISEIKSCILSIGDVVLCSIFLGTP